MNLKIPLRAAWVLPILVTGLSIGCVGADSADLDDGPTSAVEQAFSACVNPVTYADSAAVGTIQCSSTYTVSAGAPMDDCVNAVSPPLPSVLRNYVAPYNPAHFTTNGNSGAIAFPYGPWDLTQPTLLPTFRTSNDGRLTLLEGGAFGVFLPENVEYDLMPNASPARRSVGAASYRFHPFHFFNPLDTQLAVAAAPAATPQKFHIVQVPEAGHSNLCDDSSSGFDPGVLPQISDKRNPRPCSATFRNNSHEIFGDCYDITLQTNTSLCTNPQASVYACSPLPAHVAFCDSVGYAQKSPFCPSVQWEIRSNDLTVFVPAARGVAAGSWDFLPSEWTLPGDNLLSTAGAPVWVYPRQPANVSLLPAWDGDGTPNTTYNPHQSNWDQNYSEAQRCYVNGVAPTHAANAPRWCELLWSQKHTPATGFLVDGDGNASDNPVTWDGRGYNGWAMFEPATTGDGRLLIVNSMQPGLMYSYIDPALGNACDASKWVTFKPLSRLPRDPRIQDRYQIARAQMLRDAAGNVKTDAVSRANARLFRDSQGQPIPAGSPIPGAYLWIDRLGRTAVFSHAPLIRTGWHAKRATGNCPDPANENLDPGQPNVCTSTPHDFTQNTANDLVLNPDRTAGKGQSILGAWTQGKIVHLDDALNLTDWGGRGHWFADRYTYAMSLYNECDAQGKPVLTNVRPKPNTSVFSLENQLNHFDPLSPTLPFDVVWKAQGSGGVSAEIDFDDYVRNNALIIAHMNAAIDIRCGDGQAEAKCSSFAGQLRYSNGRIMDGFLPQNGTWTGFSNPSWNSNDQLKVDPTLQNAATSSTAYDATAVTPPSTLRLRGGARVEPINAGGVIGRGVYLDGQNDLIDAGYPYQAGKTEWWLGVWLDSRDLATLRTVFFFPDESSIALKGDRIVAHDGPRLAQGFGGVEQTVLLSPGLIKEGTFFHLGVKLTTETDKRVLRFSINGTPLPQALTFTHLKGKHLIHDPPDPDYYENYDVPLGFQLMTSGQPNGYTWFALAGCTTDWNPPFKGWVDEFKVYALTANDLANTFGFYDELVCNQALGTLVDPSEQVGEGFNKYLGVMRNRIGLYGYTYAGSGVAGKPVLGAFCEQLDLAADGGQGELPRQHDNPSLCANRVHKNQTSNRCLRGVKLGLTPIQAAAQLPSFSADKFCLGCHHVDSPIQGLRLPALAAGVVPSQEDPRRRPLFWPGAVTGDQHADPWLLQGRLAGWGVCDSNPNVPNTCTALDQTFDPGNQKWHFQ